MRCRTDTYLLLGELRCFCVQSLDCFLYVLYVLQCLDCFLYGLYVLHCPLREIRVCPLREIRNKLRFVPCGKFWFVPCGKFGFVPCGKFGSPYLGKAERNSKSSAIYPFLSVSAAFLCSKKVMVASAWDLFNVRTDRC